MVVTAQRELLGFGVLRVQEFRVLEFSVLICNLLIDMMFLMVPLAVLQEITYNL